MDSNEYSPSKVVKSKRARQPNWTEHEKQLFFSLTRKHKAILENKGSNTVILRRKSEAWIDIASYMNAAGYKRSIDKLKQRLGRIRAAEVKGFKEALETSSTSVVNANEKISASDMAPNIMENDLQINAKITSSSAEERDNASSICPSSTSGKQRGNICSQPPRTSVDALNNRGENDKDNSVLHLATTTDLKAQSIDQAQVKEIENEVSPKPSVLPKVYTSRRFRSAALRNVIAAEERNKEFHKYRLAIQRERLRMLHMQLKRDIVIHRNEIEIQNRKLQILRNTTNGAQYKNIFNF